MSAGSEEETLNEAFHRFTEYLATQHFDVSLALVCKEFGLSAEQAQALQKRYDEWLE